MMEKYWVNNQNEYLRGRVKSFKYAFEGIAAFFRNEPNAILHLLATIIAIILCWILKLNGTELVIIAGSITLVWITELINTAIERIMDMVTTERNRKIKIIKDIAAAAVLIAAANAVFTGIIIFLPKISI